MPFDPKRSPRYRSAVTGTTILRPETDWLLWLLLFINGGLLANIAYRVFVLLLT